MKKFYKRITALFLLITFIAALPGCAGADGGSSQGMNTPVQTTETQSQETEASPQEAAELPQVISTATSTEASKEGDKYLMRDITTSELVHEMEIGINLGNTLEACGDWINSNDITSYEKAWGSPVITEEIIAGYAAAGFSSLRIPVAWSNMMLDNYVIHPDLFERVEAVVNYTLDNGMIAMINIHWDNGWFDNFPTEYDECMKKYTSIWKQISEHFAGYGDRLIFESMNEIGYDSVWNQYGGVNPNKQKAFDLVNSINQAFVDTVRSSGGNNEKRHLVIEGYYTNIAHTCDPMFKMPEDPQNRCAVTVHYYDPPTFAILEEDASWGKARDTWGTKEDYKNLNRDMDMVKNTFVDNGIPVILGEYAACGKNKTQEMKRLYALSVAEAAYSRGICPMLWDTTGGEYDRLLCEFTDPLLIEGFKEIAAKY